MFKTTGLLSSPLLFSLQCHFVAAMTNDIAVDVVTAIAVMKVVGKSCSLEFVVQKAVK